MFHTPLSPWCHHEKFQSQLAIEATGGPLHLGAALTCRPDPPSRDQLAMRLGFACGDGSSAVGWPFTACRGSANQPLSSRPSGEQSASMLAGAGVSPSCAVAYHVSRLHSMAPHQFIAVSELPAPQAAHCSPAGCWILCALGRAWTTPPTVQATNAVASTIDRCWLRCGMPRAERRGLPLCVPA